MEQCELVHIVVDCTHILFAEVDHFLLKGSIFGLIGFAQLLKNLSVTNMVTFNPKPRTETTSRQKMGHHVRYSPICFCCFLLIPAFLLNLRLNMISFLYKAVKWNFTYRK